MQDYISANLPAIDFDQTREFYRQLGFDCQYQSDEWMILQRGQLHLEFFHHPQLDRSQSWHSACVRVQALEDLLNEWKALDWRQYPGARMTGIEQLEEIDLFYLIDPNGSLLRCIRLEDGDD
ncbi:hypothetical protein [Acinetobacter sp. WZC-1]|uniref:hypothetical protein n=1 Tax=Acinetobacter sp. WZC-1 TaxID=3459034 RepID=UPI00403DB9F1